MIEQGSLSAGERIATLRQFFRSRRSTDPGTDSRASGEWEATLWPQTEWSDTQFDASVVQCLKRMHAAGTFELAPSLSSEDLQLLIKSVPTEPSRPATNLALPRAA